MRLKSMRVNASTYAELRFCLLDLWRRTRAGRDSFENEVEGNLRIENVEIKKGDQQVSDLLNILEHISGPAVHLHLFKPYKGSGLEHRVHLA